MQSSIYSSAAVVNGRIGLDMFIGNDDSFICLTKQSPYLRICGFRIMEVEDMMQKSRQESSADFVVLIPA